MNNGPTSLPERIDQEQRSGQKRPRAAAEAAEAPPSDVLRRLSAVPHSPLPNVPAPEPPQPLPLPRVRRRKNANPIRAGF